MKNITLSLLFLIIAVTGINSQEIPNAPVNAKVQFNNARTDGKPDLTPPQTFIKNDEVIKLENKILEIRKSPNPDIDEITKLQKQLVSLTGMGGFSNAGYYPGSVSRSSLLQQFDLVGNTLVLSKSGMKGIATVTEATGSTAGRIWLVAGFSGTGSMSSPDSLRVLYSTNNGNIETPVSFELKQNYPNPFNPVTTIGYKIAKSGNVKLSVFDVTGREVAVLLNDFKQAGIYSVSFNATGLSSGIYFYKLSAEGFSDVKRMILVK